MRKRTSIIWKVNKIQLSSVVNNSKTISEILKYFGLENKGSNYKTLKKRLCEDNIVFSHIPSGLSANKGVNFQREKTPLNLLLVVGSTFNRTHLKQRLIFEKILEEKCSSCGLGTLWNSIPLSLQLDHINGISTDNRLINLRLLCPNCHSQTNNFAGKNNRKIKSTSPDKRSNRRKVKIRPTKETLQALCDEVGYYEVGRRYGVSDNAIRKWLK